MALTKIQAAGLTADAVDASKLADNSIDSEHYADGSIDNVHLADDAVGIAELSATGTASSSTYLRGDNTWQTISSVGGANAVTFNDSVAANFGTDGDQAIWHTGSTGYIRNSTGGLVIRNDAFSIKDDAESETLLTATKDGSVDLYHNNHKSFQTHGEGIRVNGPEGSAGDIHLYADEGDDNADKWKISADTSGNLSINNYTSGSWETNFKTTGNGSVEIYHDNELKLTTTSTGITVKDTSAAHSWLGLESTDGVCGYLVGQSNAGSGSEKAVAIYNAAGNETHLRGINNGSVELYYNNVKKFETISTGVKITSDSSSNGLFINHSNGNEVAQLAHGGSGDEGVLVLKDSNTSTVVIRGENGSNVDITTGGYFDLEHDSARLRLGAGNDFNLWYDGTHAQLGVASGLFRVSADGASFMNYAGTETLAAFNNNGSCDLYYDNSKKAETTSYGLGVTGTCFATSDFQLDDGCAYKAGTGDDLQIYHNGSHSYITNGTGKIFLQANAGEHSIECEPSGSVKLYYNNSKKLETTSTGGTLTGTWSGAGKILQVKKATLSQDLNTTSTSWVDTGLSESITLASTSNKIYVVVSTTPYLGGSGGERWSLQVRISASDVNETIIMEDDYWAYRASDAWKSSTGHHQVLYSPSTTNEITVNVKTIRASGSDSLWLGSNTSNKSCNTITVMEIAG